MANSEYLLQLKKIIVEDTGDARIKALLVMQNLASNAENRITIASSSLGLLPILKEIIVEDKGDARISALLVMQNLARNDENQITIASSSLGLLPILKEIIVEDKGDARKYALGVMFNLANNDENQITIASSSLGLLPILKEIIVEDKGDARKYTLGVMWNLAEDQGLCDNSSNFLDCNAHLAILTLLQEFIKLGELTSESFDRSMNVLMNLCRHRKAALACKYIGGVEVMNQVINLPGANGLKAVFILSFLAGSDESSSNEAALLESKPDVLSLLVEIFENTLLSRGGEGYKLGTFCVVLIVSAIRSLAISDANKVVLINSPHLLTLLTTIIHRYINNAEAILSCGGGGNDIESPSLVIETLLHLSFYFKDDVELKGKFLSHDTDMIQLLTDAVCVSGSRELSNIAKIDANSLISRLTGKSAESGVSGGQVALKRHVMISYSWGFRKDTVIHLAKELRRVGIDVWRDEEGSSILGPMSGSVIDTMALAVELSSAVIICVSKEYKESANCRLEANYAFDLYSENHLKIIWVMMNPKYHTKSSPERPDGWLKMMISDSLWLGLFDDGAMSSVVSSITKDLSGNAVQKIAYSPASLSVTGPSGLEDSKPQLGIVNTSNTSKYVDSWGILKKTTYVSDQTSLTKLMETLGVTNADDLGSCSLPQLKALALCLRPVPHISFMRHFVPIFCLEAWQTLQNSENILDMPSMTNFLKKYGITGADLLNVCDSSVLLELSNFLKPAPSVKFRSILGLLSASGEICFENIVIVYAS